jgi:RimJ/RimL family protein N-acetyltransferase
MIETARLVLRVPQVEDRAGLHAMWADAAVMRDLGPVKSAADSDAAIARHDGYRQAHGFGFLAVVRRQDGATIGFCGLKPGAPGTPIAGEVEAGWAISRDYWRQGYALEAMRPVVDWGWSHTDAPRIVAITAAQNAASQALMMRLGMARLADGDFLHPDFAADDPRRATVTYAIARPR